METDSFRNISAMYMLQIHERCIHSSAKDNIYNTLYTFGFITVSF